LELNEPNLRIEDLEIRLNESNLRTEDLEILLNESNRRTEDLEIRLNESNIRTEDLEILLKESNLRTEDLEIRLNSQMEEIKKYREEMQKESSAGSDCGSSVTSVGFQTFSSMLISWLTKNIASLVW